MVNSLVAPTIRNVVIQHMFNKPISQLKEEDIQTLVDNTEKESLILEYKQEILGTDHEKKELAKDISAMANTDGGYFIIGVAEEDGRAKGITGTQRKIGKQPVEEWLENVLISNVRPRISIKPKVIDTASNPDKVIIVLHIPQSSRRPHMVVADGRNAYYKRHNYQAAYADEHEVRSMFTESKVSGDEMKSFLDARNLNDTLTDKFATTPLSRLLPEALAHSRELPEGFKGHPFVLFTACPRYLEERVDIASADFRSWLDANSTVDFQGLNIDFLDYEKTVSANSVRSLKQTPDEKPILWRYVEIFRNGYFENGTGPEFMWTHEKMGLMFQLAYFTAAFWLFLKFARKLYEKIGYADEVSIIVALASAENITLHGFGKKDDKTNWVNPYDFFYGRGNPLTCKDKNVRIERDVLASELSDENIENIVKEISKRVSNAFGESISKCFDDSGHFDKNQLRGFRNLY